MDASRRIATLLLCMLVASLSTGCGSDTDDEVNQDPGSRATEVGRDDDVPSVSSSRTIALPGEQVFPEGIALDATGQRMFVSSTSDGTVFAGAVGAEALAPLDVGEGGPTVAVGLATGADGELWVAGGDTGMAWKLSQDDGEVLDTRRVPEGGATFVNDVAVASDGTAYFTDSMRPVIYRAAPDAAEGAPLEVLVDLEGTAIEYVDGFNLNGIELSPDEQQLLVVQSNTGELFRLPVEGGKPVQVDLGEELLEAGDGLELDDRRLFVVLGDSAEVAVVDLEDDLSAGTVVERLADDTFARPTTLATEGEQLFVVNSQFDAMEDPELPFTVSALELE